MALLSDTTDNLPRTDMTERLRKGFLRFRPDYVPDLIAFLAMASKRYETIRHGVQRAGVGKGQQWYESMIARCNTAQDVITELLDLAAGKWGWKEWQETNNAIDAELKRMEAIHVTGGAVEAALNITQKGDA